MALPGSSSNENDEVPSATVSIGSSIEWPPQFVPFQLPFRLCSGSGGGGGGGRSASVPLFPQNTGGINGAFAYQEEFESHSSSNGEQWVYRRGGVAYFEQPEPLNNNQNRAGTGAFTGAGSWGKKMMILSVEAVINLLGVVAQIAQGATNHNHHMLLLPLSLSIFGFTICAAVLLMSFLLRRRCQRFANAALKIGNLTLVLIFFSLASFYVPTNLAWVFRIFCILCLICTGIILFVFPKD